MPVYSTHPEYEANLPAWLTIRDVMAGDADLKRAGEKYIPRLEGQTEAEFAAYVQRGFFYNATARTVGGFIGMIFRRDPVVLLPPESAGMHTILKGFVNDVDLRGTMLNAYARHAVGEVISTGRCGTLVDWDESEQRAYLSHYAPEAIINWKESRIRGKMQLTLVVLAERAEARSQSAEVDEFEVEEVEQLRVLKLVDGGSELMVDGDGGENSGVSMEQEEPQAPFSPAAGAGAANHQPSTINHQPFHYVVQLWQRRARARGRVKDWVLVRQVTPTRRGRPLPAIPFVFHGTSHGRADVEKPPIADLVAANLDHYRLTTEYKHGMHFTALPTAWVSGFDKGADLRIGATTAWVTEAVGASAGFLEFKGEGLGTFEKALDRCERLMTVLGSRLLETQKRVSESAEALALRQAGESSIIGCLAVALTASLNTVLRWVYWWHSTEVLPEAVSPRQVNYELNTDFEAATLGAKELSALVAAWQQGAISRDTLLHNLRAGELLPPARTNEQEVALIIENASKTGLSANINSE